MDFVPGPANDVVNLYIDGVLKITGTTWGTIIVMIQNKTAIATLSRQRVSIVPCGWYGSSHNIKEMDILVDNVFLSSLTQVGPSNFQGWPVQKGTAGKTFNNPIFKNQEIVSVGCKAVPRPQGIRKTTNFGLFQVKKTALRSEGVVFRLIFQQGSGRIKIIIFALISYKIYIWILRLEKKIIFNSTTPLFEKSNEKQPLWAKGVFLTWNKRKLVVFLIPCGLGTALQPTDTISLVLEDWIIDVFQPSFLHGHLEVWRTNWVQWAQKSCQPNIIS